MCADSVDEAPQAVGGAPQVAAGSELVDLVGLVGLGAVVSAAEGGVVVRRPVTLPAEQAIKGTAGLPFGRRDR